MVSVNFVVNVVTATDEIVCLVGNDSRLGSWIPTNSLPLQRKEGNQWSCSVSLDADTLYSYRYFVSRTLPLNGSGGIGDVVRWETHWQPRQLQTGQDKTLLLPEEEFGFIDGVDSESSGWLMNGVSEVHIRLHGNAIKLLPKVNEDTKNPKRFMVRCAPIDYTNYPSEQGNTALTYEKVLVSNLACKELSHPRPQTSQGICVNQDGFVVFRHRTPLLLSLGFLLEVFACGNDDCETGARIGSAHFLPENLPETQHVITLPVISSNGACCGSLKADVLVVRPYTGTTFDMKSCDQSYWHWRDENGVVMDGGHRGMGASFSVENPWKENTVASFNAAFDLGARFIETDILVTKDLVPVIYHDFNATIAIKNTKSCDSSSSELHSIPIHDLTMEEIRCKKFFSHKGQEINGEEPPVDKKCCPFPTLATILMDTEPGLGFDLEFKYPQMEMTGEMEGEAKMDMNIFVDAILKVIYQHSKDRRIFFSTFHPEICTLLKLKQSRYPVAFLSQGQSKIYTPFLDYRSATYPQSINFAASEGILGLALHTEDLFDDTPLIKDVMSRKLILFVWGLQNNNCEVVQKWRDLKVDGVIYDRIDLHKPENFQKRLETHKEQNGENGEIVDGNSNNSNNNTSPQRRKKQTSCGTDGGSPKKKQRY